MIRKELGTHPYYHPVPLRLAVCHFQLHRFGIAANLMRQILVNHALSHRAAKRGRAAHKPALDDAVDVSKQEDVNLVALRRSPDAAGTA